MKKTILILLPIMFIFFIVVTQISIAAKDVPAPANACKDCHSDNYDSYTKSTHGKKVTQFDPTSQQACESCHNSGDLHIKQGGGKGTGMFAFAKKDDPKTKSEKCLTCHEDSKGLAFWSIGKHKSNGLSCNTCHSIHSPTKEKFLKASEPGLCFNCHKDINLQVNKQSHHPIKEGKVKCSDCHTIHGGVGPKNIKADATNELCYKCHSEKRGPYMYEHPPVEENCLICHSVHGSNHTRLLTTKVPILCQSCHDWIYHPGTPYTSFDSLSAVTERKSTSGRHICNKCHTNIHGSNGPSTKGLRYIR